LGILEAFFLKPNTIAYPLQKKETEKGYRGFHTNLLKSCIGCANCQDVCMNDAIDMIKIDKEQNPKNSSQCIPRIDYGRCCWCSLCTDVCPPSSLKLEEDYLNVTSNANEFLYMPKDR
jgi:formate hydrogenlyase subunit 6/NADH:ubiquinone oxidoreductase subunit I